MPIFQLQAVSFHRFLFSLFLLNQCVFESNVMAFRQFTLHFSVGPFA